MKKKRFVDSLVTLETFIITGNKYLNLNLSINVQGMFLSLDKSSRF